MFVSACLVLSACGGGPDAVLINNPPPAPPTISIGDVALTEGDSGQAQLTFTVPVSATSLSDISVDYETVDGTATTGVDYVAQTGTATIAAGATSTAIDVAVIGGGDVEQDGRVLRFDNDPGVITWDTFIDIRSPGDPIDVDSAGNVAGLLGMAFHPDYGNGNWYVYLFYMIGGAGTGGPYVSVISRFESKDNGQTLDAADTTELMRLVQPYSNHNGGQIGFGPDGDLCISLGDGGSGGDPGDRAQNTTNLHGAILRVDVDGGVPYAIPTENPFFTANPQLCDDGEGNADCPEIYAWGLRNPWKWSFDDATGQLWLADVGQNAWEEVDIIENGGNYGWRCSEGAHDFDLSGNCPAGLIDPVIEYSHSVGGSITGGYVYRGNAIPELDGRYVFADFSRGILFASVDDGIGGYDFEQLLDTSFLISAFAAEADGELLCLDLGSGSIRRIVLSGGSSNDPVPDQLSATGCVDMADAVDLLTDPLADTPDNLPRFTDPQDAGAALEDRARAYLHSNCSGCHRPGGPTPSNMDLRNATSFADTNTCNVMPTSGMLRIMMARIITPGDASRSILVERASRRDIHGMPPLGSNIVDADGVQLLTDWINTLPGCP